MRMGSLPVTAARLRRIRTVFRYASRYGFFEELFGGNSPAAGNYPYNIHGKE